MTNYFPKGTRVTVRGFNPAGQRYEATGPVVGYESRTRPEVLFIRDETREQLMVECYLFEGVEVVEMPS